MEIMLNQTSSYAAESAEKAKSIAQETKAGLVQSCKEGKL